MRRLASKVKRLEGARGSCPECGGVGGLAFVIEDDPVPDDRTCRRCGRPPLIMQFVETTKEEWDDEQRALQTNRPA